MLQIIRVVADILVIITFSIQLIICIKYGYQKNMEIEKMRQARVRVEAYADVYDIKKALSERGKGASKEED